MVQSYVHRNDNREIFKSEKPVLNSMYVGGFYTGNCASFPYCFGNIWFSLMNTYLHEAAVMRICKMPHDLERGKKL